MMMQQKFMELQKSNEKLSVTSQEAAKKCDELTIWSHSFTDEVFSRFDKKDSENLKKFDKIKRKME